VQADRVDDVPDGFEKQGERAIQLGSRDGRISVDRVCLEVKGRLKRLADAVCGIRVPEDVSRPFAQWTVVEAEDHARTLAHVAPEDSRDRPRDDRLGSRLKAIESVDFRDRPRPGELPPDRDSRRDEDDADDDRKEPPTSPRPWAVRRGLTLHRMTKASRNP
jgi:hypothetical protein